MPDLANWAAIADTERRLRTALAELYGFYRSTRQMLENLHRDESSVPIVHERFSGFHQYLAAAADTLAIGRGRHR